jgi:hypothetical protein
MTNFKLFMVPVFFIICCMTMSAQEQKFTNCFYDNDKTHSLECNPVFVGGEVAQSGRVETKHLQLHSVIVKETFFNSDGTIGFTGAYKYEGYSLKEILDPFVLNKKNAKEFPPLIDLYVEISNDEGDKVVLSWGEIYYPNKLNQIIIATQVMPVIPEKTKDQWPLAVQSKLIVSNDLVSVRNIDNPTKISVRSVQIDAEISKGKFPMQSDEVNVYFNEKQIDQITAFPDNCDKLTLHTIFYGKGRGLHSTKPFTGCNLKDLFLNYLTFNTEIFKKGLVVFVADDGYRAVFSLSEMCNRNDQEYSLLLYNEDDNGKGKFRVFPSCDFFSDRAVKALTEIRIIHVQL